MRNVTEKYRARGQEIQLTQAKAKQIILISQHVTNDFNFISDLTIRLSSCFQDEAARTQRLFDEISVKA